MSLTVGDLFCGAGGFSEGFRQAGFKIVWAVDNWEPARETFRGNHPQTRVLKKDITSLSAGELGSVDVLIGGPPCTFFSLANKSGNGDTVQGLRLVGRFLELVKELRPKYWIMENVPHVARSLHDAMGEDCATSDLPLIDIPNQKVLIAADYGTPQTRRRFFCGDYPIPEKSVTKDSWISLGHVLEHLPHPCNGFPKATIRIQDPLYPGIRLSSGTLRDHFEDADFKLTREDVRQSRIGKKEHPVYGRMSFPDTLDRPSRTITATEAKASRSTIVIKCPTHRQTTYRTLTIRESASAQGFPLIYQFWASSITGKRRLIGNAVPPPLARALAHAILKKEGLPIPKVPRLYECRAIPDIVHPRKARRNRYPLGRRFRSLVRIEWEPSCRVELDNSGIQPSVHPMIQRNHLREWVTRLYLGYAKEYRCYEFSYGQALNVAETIASNWSEGARIEPAMKNLLQDARASFVDWLPDASTLQAKWAGRISKGNSPQDVLPRVANLVERHFPSALWNGITIPKDAFAKVISTQIVSHGKDADEAPPKDMPIRVLGTILALSVACDVANNGVAWIKEHGSSHLDKGWFAESSNPLHEHMDT